MDTNELYVLIKDKCGNSLEKDGDRIKKSLDDILYSIISCELEAANTIVLFSPHLMRGLLFKTILSDDTLNIVSAHRIWARRLDESWESITDITHACENIRILKQGDIALFICEDKQEKPPDEELCNIIRTNNPIVYCIHDNGDSIDAPNFQGKRMAR